MLKQKLLTCCIFISFLFCCMEWGHDGAEFIFRMEYEIFLKAGSGIQNLVHPFILIPFAGQLVLIYTLFQKQVSRKLTITGMLMTGILVMLIFTIGILAGKSKMIWSTLPFIAFSVWTLLAHKARRISKE